MTVADPWEGLREPEPPLLFSQTEARRAGKIFLETGPPLISGSEGQKKIEPLKKKKKKTCSGEAKEMKATRRKKESAVSP